jgi:hypothetical protein
MEIFDPQGDGVVDGLEKAEALLALVHNFLYEDHDYTAAFDLNKEAFVGAAHIVFEVRYALRAMAGVLREQSEAGMDGTAHARMKARWEKAEVQKSLAAKEAQAKS